jgi:cell division septal protein FtsQ
MQRPSEPELKRKKNEEQKYNSIWLIVFVLMGMILGGLLLFLLVIMPGQT